MFNDLLIKIRWPMSSIATDEDIVDRWIEIDDSISVPEQTIDEILADVSINFIFSFKFIRIN